MRKAGQGREGARTAWRGAGSGPVTVDGARPEISAPRRARVWGRSRPHRAYGAQVPYVVFEEQIDQMRPAPPEQPAAYPKYASPQTNWPAAFGP